MRSALWLCALLPAVACSREILPTESTPVGALTGADVGPPDGVPFTVPAPEDIWNADSLGNHRAVLRVPAGGEGDVVVATIPWRRRDYRPEAKAYWVFQDYIAGWFVPPLRDAALVTAGVSRWHNYYLEGLDWLARNVGIDGIYIDDVAFDRVTMKRVRKILDRRRDGALIDLHSANQFNPRDGFANSANLYMEHFPYIDRLWFGEYFDYDSPPDFWMTEVAGIPFGLMGEMLQDGGNAWRGMLYGMTTRLPWAGDPTPLWAAWDRFGIEESRMIGYWVEEAPVSTGREDVLATTYLREDGGALVALASWADSTVAVDLLIHWDALKLDPVNATVSAAAIDGFQEARSWSVGDPIEVPPGRGWLLELRER